MTFEAPIVLRLSVTVSAVRSPEDSSLGQCFTLALEQLLDTGGSQVK
jgi:hypothetical protein